MTSNKKVKCCMVALNGMVACTDENKEQILDCQGFILDIADKLKERCDENTKWEFGMQEANLNWYWMKKSVGEEEK